MAYKPQGQGQLQTGTDPQAQTQDETQKTLLGNRDIEKCKTSTCAFTGPVVPQTGPTQTQTQTQSTNTNTNKVIHGGQ